MKTAVRAPLPITYILHSIPSLSNRVTQSFDVTLYLDNGRRIFQKTFLCAQLLNGEHPSVKIGDLAQAANKGASADEAHTPPDESQNTLQSVFAGGESKTPAFADPGWVSARRERPRSPTRSDGENLGVWQYKIPVLLHIVGIDHVRALETIAMAISRAERVLSPELRTIPLVGFASSVF